jgi:hypothetical protein
VASGSLYGPLKAGHEDFAASLPLLPIGFPAAIPKFQTSQLLLVRNLRAAGASIMGET